MQEGNAGDTGANMDTLATPQIHEKSNTTATSLSAWRNGHGSDPDCRKCQTSLLPVSRLSVRSAATHGKSSFTQWQSEGSAHHGLDSLTRLGLEAKPIKTSVIL